MSFAVKNAIPFVDDLVKEYLVFRGFNKTLQSFETEKKADKLKGFEVEKLVDYFFACVHSYSIEQLEELWKYLNNCFVSRLDSSLVLTEKKLHLSLRRYYITYALTTQHKEKAIEFFDLYGNELCTDPEWRDWYAIPYLKNPELNENFSPFFKKQWVNALSHSLHNFFSNVFSKMALPKILNFNVERLRRKQHESEIEFLHGEVNRLKNELSDTIRQLQLYKKLQPHERDFVKVSPTLVKHVSYESLQKAKKRLFEEEQKLQNMRSKFADEAISIQSSITTVGRKTAEVASSPAQDDDELITHARATQTAKKGITRVANQEVFTGHSSAVSRCRFSSSGEYIASGSIDGTVRIWSNSLGGSAGSTNTTIFCFSEILSLAWEIKSDRLLLCGTSDGRIKLWNSSNEKVVGDVTTDSGFPRIIDIACSPGDAVFVNAALSADGRKGYLSTWNFKTLQLQRQLDLEDKVPVCSMQFNHNGSLLVTAGRDGYVRIFDMSTNNTPIMKWKAEESADLSCVRFSRDETAVYTVGTGGEIVEWSIHNIGKKVNSYLWADSCPSDIAFDWDGNHFLVGGRNSCGYIYQTGESLPILKLEGHTKAVQTVDWHPSSNICLTGSLDHTVRVLTLT